MNKRLPIFLGVLLVCAAVWLLISPSKTIHLFIERLDDLGYDLQLRTRFLTESNPPISPIAIIDIDDKSLSAEGRWPWSRNKLAKLVDELNKQGAAVIAFDIFFSEKEENIASQVLNKPEFQQLATPNFKTFLQKNLSRFDEDTVFATSLKQGKTILAVGFLPRAQQQNTIPAPLLTLTPEQQQLGIYKATGFLSNIPVLQEAALGTGFINIFPDSDGIIRHAPLLMAYKNGVYAALSLRAVLAYLDSAIYLVTPHYGKNIALEGITIGERTITTDAKGQVLIPFVGKSYTFPYFSASDVLQGKIPKHALTGKILFIGTSATGLGDLKATAIENPFPGVEIQATIANGLLLNNFSYIPAWTMGANVFLTIILGLLAAFTFPYFGPRMLGVLIIFVPCLLLMINNWVWKNTGLILSFLVPVILVVLEALLNILYGYLFETRRREHLKEMFGQYVPSKHIDEMLKTSGSLALQGEDRSMSVLFADIRGFTTISEGLSAKDLVEMLNTFFTPMTEIIFNHKGTIDKYVGDLIMAFWGAPLKDKAHATNAIYSALEMRERVKTLQPTLAARGWPEIHIGIGVNSGIMSVGDMGSSFRRNYTVLGDEVNLASRVEGLSKFYGVDIIVTENTQKNQHLFIFRQLDKVRVKGKKKGVSIYEVVSLAKNVDSALQEELQQYHHALDDYFHQRWGSAYAGMQTLHEKYPDRKIYALYVERINEFKMNPPAEDWNGVFVHTSK